MKSFRNFKSLLEAKSGHPPGSKEHFVHHVLEADKLWFQNKHADAMKHENELDKHYQTADGDSGLPAWREDLARPNNVAHYGSVWNKHFSGSGNNTRH